jgi:hypothetical protein
VKNVPLIQKEPCVRNMRFTSHKRSLLTRVVAQASLAAVIVTNFAACGQSRLAAPTPDSEAAAVLRQTLSSDSGDGGADSGEAVSTGTGWGTLTGRFVFVGTPPEAKQLIIDKDTAVCTAEGRKLFDQSLLVDEASGGLANVVVFARKVGRIKERELPTEPLVFDQKACEFLTPVFAATVGQPIDVRNSDPIGHNTNVSGTSFNQLIPAGNGTLFTPASETGMPTMVTCNIHPWMKAYAVFRKDGYVAVSAADGSFTIPDLPAGEEIEFQVWHERSTGPNGALGADEPELDWSNKGRFTITLTADQTTDIGSIEIQASAIGG